MVAVVVVVMVAVGASASGSGSNNGSGSGNAGTYSEISCTQEFMASFLQWISAKFILFIQTFLPSKIILKYIS